jgi:hypothetical protein
VSVEIPESITAIRTNVSEFVCSVGRAADVAHFGSRRGLLLPFFCISGLVESLLTNLVQLPTTIVADVSVFMEGNVA